MQSVTDMRFQGALGTVVNIAAKMGGTSTHDIATTTYLQGHRMRTDDATSGTIIDLDGERVTSIDHKQKSYTTMTFAEMSAAMDKAQQQMSQQSRTKSSSTPTKKADNKDSVSIKYKVAVDRTGKHEKISGYDAERVFVTISLDAEATPEGEQTQQVGSMVFLMDDWVSTSAPQIAAYSEFYKAYAQKMGRQFQAQARGLQSVFASDPRIKDGFEAAAKEMQKVQGIPLRTTTYVVIVPANMTLNRQLAIDGATASAAKDAAAAKEDKPKSGFAGLMGAVKAAAEQQSNQQDKSGAKAAPPTQSTLMVMTNEVKSISTGSVPGDVFAAPTGYKEVKRATR
ncbi:MAG: hypothetical protein ABJB74_13405 [Gemmatimonas sp.]